MKSKILKITIAMLLIMTLTMTNFIFVGSSLISYAASNTETNHQNVEFDSYFESSSGKTGTTLDKLLSSDEEVYLHLQISVKKEGYFNGQISVENANFQLKETESTYVSKIENNVIMLNQINAGGTADIKIKIEPIREESFNIGLLNATCEINISGIYRDSTEKDIQIKGTRKLQLNLIENNNAESILNNLSVITNKIVKIDGEEKRLVQFSWNMGLKENNYPVRQIDAEITIPEINGKQAEVTKVTYLNDMTSVSYEYKDSKVTFSMKNEANSEGKVNWKSQGNENVILTCIYDKDADLNQVQMDIEEKVTLYDAKEITSKNVITLDNEEKDGVIDVTTKNMEESIYKGKLHSGIDRQYATKTTLQINYAKAIEYISVKESQATFVVDENEATANVYYNKTFIKKEQFDKLFGENGSLTIYNEKGEEIATINNSTIANEDGNIVISYEEKEAKAIEIKTTNPIAEGKIDLTHIKTIKESDKNTVEQASRIRTKIDAQYNMNNKEEYSKGTIKEINSDIQLENTKTEARIELNKETLSTVITNNIEIKAILKSNEEKYDLYKNPQIVVELPSQVESIEINSIDIIYDNELKVQNYEVDGRNIKITLEGEQTQYKESAVEGAMVVINADVVVNKKSASKDEEIKMTYNNQNMYTNGISSGETSSKIKIVAPKDITTINSIEDLNIETIGQEEVKKVMIARGQEEQQVEVEIEIINNNENSVENVKVLGDLPTNGESNNMEIEMVKEISLQGAENAKIYYSENENATDNLENAQNEWKEESEDIENARKYLIIVDEIAAQSSVQGSYEIKIPANLEYNQNATTSYEVEYTNSLTQIENTLKATEIDLQTGIGPKAETKMTATVAGKESETVKNGEVIKYKIEVSNVGTEDITNLKVTADVPEGTTMVEPEENYEYTGASYYKELDSKTYESTIKTLKVGEVVYKEYEVRVNKETEAGTELSNTAEITYGDVKKQSEQIKYKTESGTLRVSVKRVTDRNIDLYELGNVRYFAIIENISNEKQENVKVKTNLSNNVVVENLELITGMEKTEISEGEIHNVDNLNEAPAETREITEEELTQSNSSSNTTSEQLEYKEEVNIGSLEAGEIKVLSYGILINKIESGKIDFSVIAKSGQKEYRSNQLSENVNNFAISMSMSANTESSYVKTGDNIEYTITIQNESTSKTSGIEIKDLVPKALTINKITVDGQEVDTFSDNDVVITDTIPANSNKTIQIDTVVDYSEGRDEAEAITNIAYAELFGEKIATTSEVSHIIQADEEKESNETPEDNGNNGGNNENEGNSNNSNGDVAEGNKTIAGLAWYDENANGKKDSNENAISNVKVRLLNANTNNLVKDKEGNILEVTTNENGIYIIDKVLNGKYIVIFDYNNTEYTLTKYKVEGALEKENSNAMMSNLTIDSNKKQVAATDIIEVKDDNISNINIGLIKLKNFDLKLDKYVSRILIQDANGTTVKEYNNSTMAKVELDAKKVNGSTVIIEYNIVVTNIGEVEGYAKKIVDYMPNNLKFSSELNKDWYQSGDVLYSTSLANDKLAAGESKTLKLTLTKSMTEENTGLINNRAEIAESYNELGLVDSNSTPGNNSKGENDMGEAEVILSIKTGGAVYISIAIIILIVVGATTVVIIRRKKLTKDNK